MKGTRPNGQVPFCIYMWNNNYTPFVTVLFLHIKRLRMLLYLKKDWSPGRLERFLVICICQHRLQNGEHSVQLAVLYHEVL